MASYQIYPLENYHFGVKQDAPMKSVETNEQRLSKLEASYNKQGLRRTVSGILLVHQHGHPHVLLMQNSENEAWKLPGGKLSPGENDVDGLKRKLANKVAPSQQHLIPDWDIGDLVGVWWKPNFDSLSYPYVPAHVSKPKECMRIYLIHLPKECTFAVMKGVKFVAIPMYELYDNSARYGPMISTIPQVLARYTFNYIAAPEGALLDADGANIIKKEDSNTATATQRSEITVDTQEK